MQTHKEKSRIESIAANSLYAYGVNTAMIEATFRVFERYITNGETLELGPGEGVMTNLLASTCSSLTVVDGAQIFLDTIKAKHPHVKVVNALFEEFEPEMRFSNIILGHVLEHVDNPVEILRRASNWLNPGGRILAAVPNSRSLHRQAAVLMGLLPFEESLNEADHHHGHRRVYNPESFRGDFLKAGLSIEVSGGYWLKPVSNGQIERDWTPAMLDAFMVLGERYPDIAGEIYVIARNEPRPQYFHSGWRQSDQG